MKPPQYFSNNNFFSPSQCRFRHGYVTEFAIHKITKNICSVVDNKNYQIIDFCDLSEAFDSISHKTIIVNLWSFLETSVSA